MKRNVILLIDADTETCAAALTASELAGLDIRFAKIQNDFSELAGLALDDVATIVLDYDPEVHGPAIIESLERWLPARPVIFVSSTEDLSHRMKTKGIIHHLIKPITAPRLAQALTRSFHEPNCACPSCDRWGHPFSGFRPAQEAAI
jgi:DNA-binding NtrC family response regulator